MGCLKEQDFANHVWKTKYRGSDASYSAAPIYITLARICVIVTIPGFLNAYLMCKWKHYQCYLPGKKTQNENDLGN